jgi:hypothetical protein
MATMMVSCDIPNKKTEIGDKDKPKTETTSPQTTSSTQTTKTVEITNPPIITVSAVTLYSDYNANEVRADNKYKDKILKVSGTVKQIRKIFGDIIVEISGSEWGSIDCKIVTEQTDEASNLNKGQQVTIVGKCTGMLITGDVKLKDCTIQ